MEEEDASDVEMDRQSRGRQDDDLVFFVSRMVHPSFFWHTFFTVIKHDLFNVIHLIPFFIIHLLFRQLNLLIKLCFFRSCMDMVSMIMWKATLLTLCAGGHLR